MKDLKDVPHPFVEIELHWDARVIQGLVLPHRVAEEDFFRPSLNERGWKTLGVVRVDGGDLRMPLVLGGSIGSGTIL